jgi:hypothetical protein
MTFRIPAGRPDDPRSVKLACKLSGGKKAN